MAVSKAKGTVDKMTEEISTNIFCHFRNVEGCVEFSSLWRNLHTHYFRQVEGNFCLRRRKHRQKAGGRGLWSLAVSGLLKYSQAMSWSRRPALDLFEVWEMVKTLEWPGTTWPIHEQGQLSSVVHCEPPLFDVDDFSLLKRFVCIDSTQFRLADRGFTNCPGVLTKCKFHFSGRPHNPTSRFRSSPTSVVTAKSFSDRPGPP